MHKQQCESVEKGGNAYTPALLIAAIGALIRLQAFISSLFDKGLDMSSSDVGDKGVLEKDQSEHISDNFCKSHMQNTLFWNPTKNSDHEKVEGPSLNEEILAF